MFAGLGVADQRRMDTRATKRLLYKEWRDPGAEPKLHLFGY
jgi:hypothetical protein